MAYRVAASGASVNLRVSASVPKTSAIGVVEYHHDTQTVDAFVQALRPDDKWHWMCFDLKAAMEYVWWAPTALTAPSDNVLYDSEVTRLAIQMTTGTSKMWIDEVVFANEPVTLAQIHPPLEIGPSISSKLFSALSVEVTDTDAFFGMNSSEGVGLVRKERTVAFTIPTTACSTGLPLLQARFQSTIPSNMSANMSAGVVSKRLSIATKPLGGSFDVGWTGDYKDEWGNHMPADYVTVEHDASANDMRTALLRLRDVGPSIMVSRVGSCLGYQWKVTFSSNSGDVPNAAGQDKQPHRIWGESGCE
jgi:hypothetical protein